MANTLFNFCRESGDQLVSGARQARGVVNYAHGLTITLTPAHTHTAITPLFSGPVSIWGALIVELAATHPPYRLSRIHLLTPSQFNSWDRQVFLTYKNAGTTGFFADWNLLTQNFLISNYDSSQAVDK